MRQQPQIVLQLCLVTLFTQLLRRQCSISVAQCLPVGQLIRVQVEDAVFVPWRNAVIAAACL
jgi:hypothetical protein